MPESLNLIENGAFEDCTSIKELSIPESVNLIESGAFKGCSSLELLSLPSGLKEIKKDFFEGCSALKELKIPKDVKIIDSGAFRGCDNLVMLDLPSCLTELKKGFFEGCSSLKELKIPDNVKTIHSGTLKGCRSLVSLSLPFGLKEIEKGGFEGCCSLIELAIPEGVKSIEDGAFRGCSSLKSLTLPSGVVEIKEAAFEGCSSLLELAIPESVKSIETGAFRGCSSLKSLTLPSGVVEIKEATFEGCSSLIELAIPESVKSIETGAFKGCSSLKSLTLPSGVVEIKEATFEGCAALKDISISKGVKSIGARAFKECLSLKLIILPDDLFDVHESSFEYCSSLIRIEFPFSLIKKGVGPFSVRFVSVGDIKWDHHFDSLLSHLKKQEWEKALFFFDEVDFLAHSYFLGKLVDDVLHIHLDWGVSLNDPDYHKLINFLVIHQRFTTKSIYLSKGYYLMNIFENLKSQTYTKCQLLGILNEKLKGITDTIVISCIMRDVIIPPGPPSENDIQLAKIWANGDDKDSTMARMLSARLAEKSVASYYMSQGYQVFDVAGSQTEKGNNEDWKLFDLEITKNDGRSYFVDVKNARKSDNKRQRYTAHCVPKFKESRRIGVIYESDHQVYIAGALSDWQPYDKEYAEGYYFPDFKNLLNEPRPVKFLGITGLNTLDKIRKEFQGGRLDMSVNLDDFGKTFLPPWVFEFSKKVYQKRDQLIQNLDLNQFTCIRESPEFLALAIVNSDWDDDFLYLPKNQQLLCLALKRRTKKYGLRLPMIFSSILEHFVECLAGNDCEFDADFIHGLLMIRKYYLDENRGDVEERHTSPLFVFDPVNSVQGLLHSLEILWNQKNSKLKGFKKFKLERFNILRAKKEGAESSWITLLAYCGGWFTAPLKPCGKTPLVLGECELCEYGYLICPDCGHCCSKKENEKISSANEGSEEEVSPF